jgi:hypothetical protein
VAKTRAPRRVVRVWPWYDTDELSTRSLKTVTLAYVEYELVYVHSIRSTCPNVLLSSFWSRYGMSWPFGSALFPSTSDVLH